MSTITKQWLQQKISDMETARDEIPFGLDEDDSNTLAARIALASLEAEAVGEVVLGEYDDCGCHPDARVACIAADCQADWENFKDGTRLYTSPPAPASMKDHQIRELVNELRDIAVEYHGTQQLRERIVRTVRAAMLQGADGNAPVIPDGWVACSERMPEEGQEVIVMDVARGKVQSGMIYEDGCFVDFSEQYYEVENPSHWMPLPAAP